MKTVAFALLAAAPAALAANFDVTVGKGGVLAFDPPSVNATQGDTVTFHFYPKNHSVVQSTLAAPCTPGGAGFSIPFQPVATLPTDLTTLPQSVYNVANTSAPLWFFCGQTTPLVHCAQGMVFAINPGPDGAANSFSAFQAKANATAGTTGSGNGTAPGGNNTGAPAPGSGGSGAGGNGSATQPGSALGVDVPMKAVLAGALAAIGGAISLL